MSYRIGDTLFTQNSSPAIVVGHDEAKSTVKFDRDFDAFQVATRHGLINGIAPETRHEFDKIMDEVMDNKDDTQRVDMLRNKIEELKNEPKNFRLVQYLDGEVRHIMNIKGVKPRFFNTEDYKVR